MSLFLKAPSFDSPTFIGSLGLAIAHIAAWFVMMFIFGPFVGLILFLIIFS